MGRDGYGGLSPEDRRFFYEEMPDAFVDAGCRQVRSAFKTILSLASAVAVSLFGVGVLCKMVGLFPAIAIYSACMAGFFYVDRRLAQKSQKAARSARAYDSMEYGDFDVTPRGR